MVYQKEIVDEVLLMLAKDKKVKEINTELGISISTIYNLKKKYTSEILNLAFYVRTSKEIKDLINQKKLNEAYDLASDDRFRDYFPIQSQLITILMQLNMLNEAYELASEPRFKDSFQIQYQLIIILKLQKRYNEALELANEKRFDNNIYILKYRNKLRKKVARNKHQCKKLNPKFDFFSIIEKATIDNYNDILNEIEISKIPEWQKIIYHITLDEKTNYPLNSSLKYLKSQMVIYANNETVLKIIKSLINRLKNKQKIWDINFYQQLLNSKVVDSISKEKGYLQELSESILKQNSLSK